MSEAENSGSLSREELQSLKKTVTELQEALDKDPVAIDYYAVRQKVNPDGSLGNIAIQKFD